jgi:hypothetical protein
MMFISISNFDLEDLAHEWGIVLNGVVAKDHLNGGVKQGGYIINLQDYNDGEGTHWVALYVEKKNIVYFDSFGGAPPDDVLRFMKRARGYARYGCIDQIQHLDSEACGYFCLAFLFYMQNKQNEEFTIRLNTFANMFQLTQFKRNEQVLKSFFKQNELNYKTS